MTISLVQLALAVGAFLLTHFIMSGPLRKSLIGALDEQGFLLLYSLVSICLLGAAIVLFARSPDDHLLWDGTHPVAWTLASLLTILATALFLRSFQGNPALPGVKAAGLATVIPSGVYTITRHPMMWAISLWAFGHIVAAPSLRVLILMGGMTVLALLGSHLQDKRKLAGNTREFGPWQRRTSFWPQLQNVGKLKLTWITALVIWFLATMVHWELYGVPAGLWMWLV
ncbi:MAG: hypothetical protein RIS85_2667 [Pseudomonadota bacterium]|jgi:uncharacterized membrane protein